MKPIKTEWIIPEECDAEESILLCPVCESPPDYCQDHHHYTCPDCGEPLELDRMLENWECWTCPAEEKETLHYPSKPTRYHKSGNKDTQ